MMRPEAYTVGPRGSEEGHVPGNEGYFRIRRRHSDRDLGLALSRLYLSGTLLPVGARLKVEHSFVLDGRKRLEAVYSFILPRDAVLRSFVVSGPGFQERSKLKPTRIAEADYEKGLEDGHLSTLARNYRDGVVNLSLGNLRSGKPVTVSLEILAGVETRDGGYRLRFPFTMAPSYHRRARTAALPGGGAVELPMRGFGDVLLPEFRADARDLHEIGFSLELGSLPPGFEIASPSHPLRIVTAEGKVRVSLATTSDLPNRDLVLEVLTEKPQMQLFSGRGAGGRKHFALCLPSTDFGKSCGRGGRVVFILDRSGSMKGITLRQAKWAIECVLREMTAGTRFGLLAFSNRTEVFAPDLTKAGPENLGRALRWLRGIDAQGGTELSKAIRKAGEILGKGGGDIFLLTDGQVFGGEDVLAVARSQKARIHVLGIGSASQDRFLTLLARNSGGVSRFIMAREPADEVAVELFQAMSEAVAEKLKVRPDQAGNCKIQPTPDRTVYAGCPLLVWGEVDLKSRLHLGLKWRDGMKEKKRKSIPLELEEGEVGETLRLLRGARLITDLEAKIAGKPTKAQSAQLEELSRQYQLASREMSLVAVVECEGDEAGALPKTQVIPVGLPRDMAPERVFALRASPCCYETDADWGELGDLLRMMPAKIRPEEEVGELLDLLEFDGGMPGETTAERVLGTLLLLLAASASGSSTRRGPLRASIIRMLSFLATLPVESLDEEHSALIDRVRETLEWGEVTRVRWLKTARKLYLGKMKTSGKRGKRIDSAWKMLLRSSWEEYF